MKILLRGAEYTFTPSSNTITFSVVGFDVRGLLYVGNVTTNKNIYVPTKAAFAIASSSGSTVTFAAPMVGMAASDLLLVVYDDRVGAQAISAASLPLPTGAATSAKQPALGTAGSPSTDVISVQGVASGIPQPISATALPLPTNAAQDGSDPASPAVANAGTGIRGWLATIAGLLKLGASAKAASSSVTIATDQGNLEPGGTAITAATMPTGGLGLTGWLSAIWSSLATSLGSATGGTAATVSRLVGGVYNTTAPTLTNGQQVALQFDVNGKLLVSGAGGGGSSGSITAAGTNGTSAQAFQGITGGVPAPTLAVATSAANAVLTGRVTSAASINATTLKTSAGNLVEIDVYNVATALRYLRIFNKASAPAPGSDGALLIWEIPIPAGGGFTWTPPIPLSLSTGISYVITAAAGGTDTTNTAAGDVVGIIRYL